MDERAARDRGDRGDGSSGALIATDAEGRVTSWNDVAERLCGIPAASALGRPLAELVRRRPVDDARLPREVVQAQKMEALGLLAAGVAHELNNPLASIVAYSQLIRTDQALPEELRRQADLLIQESSRIRRIVHDLLGFARQEPAGRTATHLDELVRAVLDLQTYTFGPGRIEVTVDLPDDLPPVEVDRGAIQQVLVNLTINAAQAIAADGGRGSIRIAAEVGRLGDAPDGEASVRLAVTDDGPGVPAEASDRLFDPFFSTKPAGRGTGLGTGLGLPVSAAIVEAHGGRLRHEPGPGDRGATFVVELPIRARGDEQPAPGLPPAGRATAQGTSSPAVAPTVAVAGAGDLASRPARILVLDDEPAIRDFLTRILRRGGYEPVPVATGSEAIERVRQGGIDAILCDHRMAGMNGTEVHAAVGAIDSGLARRFAFMSGDVLNPELQSFVEANGVHLLAKPFDIASVGRLLAEVVPREPGEG